MDAAAKADVVKKYITAINTDSLALISEIYADNATVEDPVGSPPKEGIEAILAFYKSFFGTGVKLQLIGSIRCAGNAAAFPFTASMGPTKLEVIDVFEFDKSGKVVSMKAYWGMENRV